ncbi:MAG: thiolase family protein [Proteobacteria bacterium]|nr:thiolase family protein [Pseudomonadota bacterium]MBU1452746.1 thiolase family protein [Pseudomonadota bacterium]MBU2467886.1 thiolase family protein [Pseudomonadota bacterium]MBU2519379.1 thiolase family protein [Pseudomonadota bacterium]
MNKQDAVIVEGARLPVARGGAGGALSMVPAEKFGAHLLKQLMSRSAVNPLEIDDVIMGNVMGAYLCFSRLCLLEAGLPIEVPGYTLDRNCASGLQAIASGSQAIRCGEAGLIVAGGADSMTRQPWFVEKPATGFPRGPLEPRVLAGGRVTAPESFGDYSMGETAENVAERFGISREDQEALALESHRRARRAWEEGRFDQEVIPIPVPQPKGEPKIFSRDETIREDEQLARMPRLPTIFRQGGTVTAATSSPVTDGAAAVVMMSAGKAADMGLKPLVRVVSTASAGVEPSHMGLGPIPAVRKALKLAGLTVNDLDLVEFNEAFAAQALACYRELGLDQEKVNVNGGGMALGHPIGATGARLTVTLMYEMVRRGARYGLATMCVGGGQGTAVIYELAG